MRGRECRANRCAIELCSLGLPSTTPIIGAAMIHHPTPPRSQDCNHHGVCLQGKCECYTGWGGPACDAMKCPNDCSGHGACQNGTCTCHPGYGGEDCSRVTCPDKCSHNGVCHAGQCVCYTGWMGDSCNLRSCPNDCSMRGYCINGTVRRAHASATQHLACDDAMIARSAPPMRVHGRSCGQHGPLLAQSSPPSVRT